MSTLYSYILLCVSHTHNEMKHAVIGSNEDPSWSVKKNLRTIKFDNQIFQTTLVTFHNSDLR